MAFLRKNCKSLIKKPRRNKELDHYFHNYLERKYENCQLKEMAKGLKKKAEINLRCAKIITALFNYFHGELRGKSDYKAIDFLSKEDQNIVFEILDDFVFMW